MSHLATRGPHLKMWNITAPTREKHGNRSHSGLGFHLDGIAGGTAKIIKQDES